MLKRLPRIIRPALISLPKINYSYPTIYLFSSDNQSHPDFKKKVKPQQTIDEDTQKEKLQYIEQVLKDNKIVLFMKGIPESPMCGYSNFAVQVLKFYQIQQYKSVDILRDNVLREVLKKYANWPTYPQLWVNGKLVGGVDILQEMHKDGSLKELFSE